MAAQPFLDFRARQSGYPPSYFERLAHDGEAELRAASPCWRRHLTATWPLLPRGPVAGVTTFTTLARTSTGLQAC